MHGPLLVGYDASPAARAALEQAAARAGHLRRRLVLVTVVPTPLQWASFTSMLLPGVDVPAIKEDPSYEHNARRALDEVAAGLRKGGIEVEAVVRLGDSADEILSVADELDADEIFVGYKSYEKSVRYGLGSTTDKIVRYSPRTVTVVRPRKR